ncbi:MAG: TRAP transporter substrate-binding protein [Treponema sp.]|nr:TRAP transporter substrate-binding protein [Treponema sp.]
MLARSKIAGSILVVLIASFITSCARDDRIIMRVGDVWSASHPNSYSIINVFKPMIEEGTNGAIYVEIYGAGALGSEQTLWDSVRSGALEVGILGTLISSEYRPMVIAEWPFLYRDVEHAKSVWTGSFAEEFMSDFNSAFSTQMNLLAVGPNSARTFTSNVPLRSIHDFSGQRFRVPATQVHVGIVNDLGASSHIIPLTDLFSSMQTGVVDGQDNGMVTVLSERFHEVQRYLLETNHLVAIMTTVINAPFLNSLRPEYQQVVRDAARAAAVSAWEAYIVSLDNDRQTLRNLGVTVTQVSDSERLQFIEAIQPTLSHLHAENPWAQEVLTRIGNVR